MALTSASTTEEIVAAYVDSSLYDLDNSTTLCRQFIQACRLLLIQRPESISIPGMSTKFHTATLTSELRRAESWYAVNSAAGRRGSVRVVDLSNVRNR